MSILLPRRWFGLLGPVTLLAGCGEVSDSGGIYAWGSGIWRRRADAPW